MRLIPLLIITLMTLPLPAHAGMAANAASVMSFAMNGGGDAHSGTGLSNSATPAGGEDKCDQCDAHPKCCAGNTSSRLAAAAEKMTPVRLFETAPNVIVLESSSHDQTVEHPPKLLS